MCQYQEFQHANRGRQSLYPVCLSDLWECNGGSGVRRWKLVASVHAPELCCGSSSACAALSRKRRIDWDNIGQMRAQLWREAGDQLRMRLRIAHPMDTGLHKEPAFFIQEVHFADADGQPLADMEVHEPVAANPTFTMQFADPRRGDHIAVMARDNSGGVYQAKVPMVRTAAMSSFREGRL